MVFKLKPLPKHLQTDGEVAMWHLKNALQAEKAIIFIAYEAVTNDGEAAVTGCFIPRPETLDPHEDRFGVLVRVKAAKVFGLNPPPSLVKTVVQLCREAST